MNKPRTSKKAFLIRVSIWKLRDWYTKEIKLSQPVFMTNYLEPKEEYHLPFKLNLKFLFHGTSFFPLSTLSSYERYLIFLRYKENKTLQEIADIVQKQRKVVAKHIKNTIYKLRSLRNANNTR